MAECGQLIGLKTSSRQFTNIGGCTLFLVLECSFYNLRHTQSGGAFLVNSVDSSITIKDSSFYDCYVFDPKNGGAIFLQSYANLVMDHNCFSKCSATNGQAAYLLSNKESTVNITQASVISCGYAEHSFYHAIRIRQCIVNNEYINISHLKLAYCGFYHYNVFNKVNTKFENLAHAWISTLIEFRVTDGIANLETINFVNITKSIDYQSLLFINNGTVTFKDTIFAHINIDSSSDIVNPRFTFDGCQFYNVTGVSDTNTTKYSSHQILMHASYSCHVSIISSLLFSTPLKGQSFSFLLIFVPFQVGI